MQTPQVSFSEAQGRPIQAFLYNMAPPRTHTHTHTQTQPCQFMVLTACTWGCCKALSEAYVIIHKSPPPCLPKLWKRPKLIRS